MTLTEEHTEETKKELEWFECQKRKRKIRD
jgi:hypothetical protein